MNKFATLARRIPFFPWTEDIETGIRVIDMDHRSLVDIVNELHELNVEGRAEAELPRLMTNLLKYCTEHFFREEKIMEEYGYPDLAQHRERHRGIRRFIHALHVIAVDGPHRIDTDKLLHFLRDWLENHIGKSDMDYVHHLRQAIADTRELADLADLAGTLPDGQPEAEISVELKVPGNRALIAQQVAEILRGNHRGVLDLDKEVQRILNDAMFTLSSDESQKLVSHLLR